MLEVLINNTKNIWLLPCLFIFILMLSHFGLQHYSTTLFKSADYASQFNLIEEPIYLILMGICEYWLFIRVINKGAVYWKNSVTVQKYPTIGIILPFILTVFKNLALLIIINLTTQKLNLPDEVAYVLTKATSIFIICALSGILFKLIDIAEQLLLHHYTVEQSGLITERKIHTQTLILKRVAYSLLAILTAGAILVLFDNVRALGASVLTTAGVIGLLLTFTAQRSLGSIFSGLEIALTQPIKIGDKIQIENEVGTVEEINFRNVVIKMWNWRRMIVPTHFFLEKAFQNWNRVEHTNLLEVFYLYVDFTMPVEQLRNKFYSILKNSDLWDKDVGKMQVSDLKESSMQLKIVVSAKNSDEASNLGAHIREELISYIAKTFPDLLPKTRSTTLAENSSEQTINKHHAFMEP